MNTGAGIALSSLLLLTSACDAGQPQGDETPRGAAPTFGSLDANADDSLSQAEAQWFSDLAAVFGEADADGDGMLSSTEYADAVRNII